jgi:hypothetical protein
MPTPLALKQEAPALFIKLQKFLRADEVLLLSDEFARVSSFSDSFEGSITRRTDAPFNPKPARIASILIDDGGVKSVRFIQAAFWSCVPIESREASGVSGEILNVLSQVEQATRTGTSSPEVSSLVFAILLDQIRHVHMMTASADQRRKVVQEVEAAASVALHDSSSVGLREKLHHAVRMQKRVLE